MKTITPTRMCQVYLLLVMLAATILSLLPYSPLALVLLLVMLFTVIHPLSPRLHLAMTLAMVFLIPLVLAPLLDSLFGFAPFTAQGVAAIFILPAIYLTDHYLKENTRYTPAFSQGKTGRHVTRTYVILFVLGLVMMLLSPVVDNFALLFTGIILILYLLGRLTAIFLTIPYLPITFTTTRKRMIAGDTATMALSISNRAVAGMPVFIRPTELWAAVQPGRLMMNAAETMLDLTFTPPLAGPASPRLQVSVLDPRGFIEVNQDIEPVNLHIIPRARYAAWLAEKFLAHAGTLTIAAVAAPPKTPTMRKGIEYLDSRTYQAGDPLKDIDWKHTTKLRQLIVKEYTEGGGQAAIIAVNLSVSDAEAADRLAYNLITTALTLAQEGIPTALAAYHHQGIVLCRPVSDPSAILRETLSLVKEIAAVELPGRYLEPVDIERIRRNLTRLKQAKSEPAQRLYDVLNFEYHAINESARKHPASLAILSLADKVPVPAMILLVTQFNHDTEALLVTADKLAHRQFTTIPVSPNYLSSWGAV